MCPGIERIRFATSHPRYFTERLIRACAELPKVCEHFHIPFQSGDNDVLKAMAAGLHPREVPAASSIPFAATCPMLPSVPMLSLGSPAKPKNSFKRTLDLVNDIAFDQLNTAAYSPRPGTPRRPVGAPARGRGQGRPPAAP